MAELRTSTTAEDTLAEKSRDPDIISGGHRVAKALRNEGVDTIASLERRDTERAEVLTRYHTLDLAAHGEKNCNFFE